MTSTSTVFCLWMWWYCFVQGIVVIVASSDQHRRIDTSTSSSSSPSCSLIQPKTLPRIDATSLIPFTQSKLRLVLFAGQLSELAYHDDMNITTVFKELNRSGTVHYYDTGPDAAITYATTNYCLIAFRGSLDSINTMNTTTTLTSLNYLYEDWIQENFNVGSYYVTKRRRKSGTTIYDTSSSSNEGCYVQKGFYRSYSGIGLKNIYHFVDTCMSSSNNKEKKQLVLTGHSQGGAAAIVGSIDLYNYQPLVITFGSPPVLKQPSNTCSALPIDHIWRFINTDTSSDIDNIQYDPVPFVEVFGLDVFGQQVGASIHIPPSTTSYDLFYRTANDTTSYMTASSLHVLTHYMTHYLPKLCSLLLDTQQDPFDVNGYSTGTVCMIDEECQSFSLHDGGGCWNHHCEVAPVPTPKTALIANGEPCHDAIDCVSNRCDYTWSGQRICYQAKGSGSLCNEDNDCQSNLCTWTWTCQ